MSLESRPVRRYVPLAMVLWLGAVAWASPALAQSGRGQYDATDIQRKVQKSLTLQKQALQSLGDSNQAVTLVRSAWTELRAAQHEMIMNASGAKYVDPLFEMSNRRAEEALGHLQAAGDALATNPRASGVRANDEDGGQPANPYLDGVRRHIEQAAHHLARVLTRRGRVTRPGRSPDVGRSASGPPRVGRGRGSGPRRGWPAPPARSW
jgi:hypothetical protein